MSPRGALLLFVLALLGSRHLFAAAFGNGSVQNPLPSQSPSTQTNSSKAEELFPAVRAGDTARVNAALEAGINVNTRDPLGGTALLEAAWVGNLEIVRLLVAHGADVNAVHRESGATALKYAVLTSRPNIVQLLLASGADVRLVYRDGQTLLHLAAARSNLPILEMLLKFRDGRGGIDIEATNRDGNTPLDEAVLHDQLSSVNFLITHGGDVNRTRPNDGRSAIHEASVKGFADLLPTLIKAGASPLQRDRFGQTPLDLALAYKNGNVIAELLKTGALKGSQGAAEQAMEAASLKGQTEIVQTLLKSGFDVNRPTASGSTYLHDAALKNQGRVARILIAAGARLDAPNRSGGTPLHDAALGGSVEVINLLLDSGAAIDARDSEARATPLMLAASLDRLSAVQLLLRRGADPKLTDSNGHTAIDRAKLCDDPALLRALRPEPKHTP